MNKATPVILHPVVSALLFAGSLFGANALMRTLELSALRLAAALLPAAGFILLVLAHVRWYRNADELQQRIQLNAWVTAFVTSMLGALLLHFVRKAGFFPLSDYPQLDYFGDVLPYAFILGYLFGYWNTARRYR